MMIAGTMQPAEGAPAPNRSALAAPEPPDRTTLKVDALEGRWWVLHTRARNEKAVASDLDRLQIGYFLPLVACRRTYGRRSVRVKIPLFPGYVFLCGGSDEREAALRTNRVANVLAVGDQEKLKADLLQIQRVVESEETVDLYPRLKEGCRCRVIGGSLVGLEGVVLRRRGLWRVYIGVQFLSQSAELDIDPVFLEVLD